MAKNPALLMLGAAARAPGAISLPICRRRQKGMPRGSRPLSMNEPVIAPLTVSVLMYWMMPSARVIAPTVSAEAVAALPVVATRFRL